MGREATDAGRLYRHCGPRLRVAVSLVRVRCMDDGVGDLHRHPSARTRCSAVPRCCRRRPEKAACLLMAYLSSVDPERIGGTSFPVKKPSIDERTGTF